MSYIIAIRTILGDFLLTATVSNKVMAFDTLGEAIIMFDIYRERFWSENYETHISTGMSLNLARPYILNFNHEAQALTNYILSHAISKITGGGSNYQGVLINPELIDNFTEVDIAHQIMFEAEL